MLFRSHGWRASFFRGAKVTDLIVEKLPVSISLGLWATLITYLISIPLGIRIAIHNGIAFGFISWTVIKLLSGRVRELNAPLIILSVLFVVKLGWFNA